MINNKEYVKKLLTDLEEINHSFSKKIFEIQRIIYSEERIRNEDGESAFPLERPKTCTPIVSQSSDGSVSEFEYCPSNFLYGMHKLTESELEQITVIGGNSFMSKEDLENAVKNGMIIDVHNLGEINE